MKNKVMSFFDLEEREQKIISTFLKNKDYKKIDEIIGDNQEKAKLIFNLVNDKEKLEELDHIIKNQTTNQTKRIKTNKVAAVTKILVQIKDDFLSLIEGEENLLPLAPASFRGNPEKKPTEKNSLFFKEFSLFKYNEENKLTLARDSWFKELLIKKIEKDLGQDLEHLSKQTIQLSAYRQSHYQANLEAGKYEIKIDGKKFYLELFI